ncbi:MAG: response regulator [Cellulosilyticaceae bacterium]
MNHKGTLLIIEDDKAIRRFVTVALEVEGYHYLEASDGKMGLSMILSHKPDVILLDLGLPDMDGLEILEKIRDWCQAKIIVISAREQERDKVKALDEGADDFLTKPFSIGELMARIRVAFRQKIKEKNEGNPVFKVGGLTIDYAKRQVSLEGKEVHLTPIEYNLLVVMSHHAGKVLTHHYLLKEVWGSGYGESDTRSLRVFMASIRRKLESDTAAPRYILTEVGIGYKLADE